jgi:hypothetical protein
MTGKRNWGRDRDRRRAQEQGTVSVHRVTPPPRSTRDERSDEPNVSSPPDERTERALALWAFMREMARCDIDGRPIPNVPKEALKVIGVTSQSLAVNWIRNHKTYGALKQQLLKEDALHPNPPKKD